MDIDTSPKQEKKLIDCIFQFFVDDKVTQRLKDGFGIDLRDIGIFSYDQYVLAPADEERYYNCIYKCFQNTKWESKIKVFKLNHIESLEGLISEISTALGVSILMYSCDNNREIKINGYKDDICIKYDTMGDSKIAYDIVIGDIFCYFFRDKVIDEAAFDVVKTKKNPPTYFNLILSLIEDGYINVDLHPEHIKREDYTEFKYYMGFDKVVAFDEITTDPTQVEISNTHSYNHIFCLIDDERTNKLILYDMGALKKYIYTRSKTYMTSRLMKVAIDKVIECVNNKKDTLMKALIYTYNIEFFCEYFALHTEGLYNIETTEDGDAMLKCEAYINTSHGPILMEFRALDEDLYVHEASFKKGDQDLFKEVVKLLYDLNDLFESHDADIHAVGVNDYLLKKFILCGCFTNVHKLIGNIREFVQENTAEYKQVVRNGQSMFTVGEMYRLSFNDIIGSAILHSKGFPIGAPKKLTKTIFARGKYDWYVAKFNVTKMPTGRFVYTDHINNNVAYCNTTDVYILESQGAKLEFVEGYYWDQGFNTTIKDEIIQFCLTDKAIKTYRLYSSLVRKPNMYNLTMVKSSKVDIAKVKGSDIFKIKSIEELILNGRSLFEPEQRNLFLITRFAEKYTYGSYVHCGNMIYSEMMRIMYGHANAEQTCYLDLDSIVVSSSSYRKMKAHGSIGPYMGQFRLDNIRDKVETKPYLGQIQTIEPEYINKAIYLNSTSYCMSIVDKTKKTISIVYELGDLEDEIMEIEAKSIIDRYAKLFTRYYDG